jgi:hypothetical protein
VYLALICRLVFELRGKVHRVKALSRTDPLTGAFNSRSFSSGWPLSLKKGAGSAGPSRWRIWIWTISNAQRFARAPGRR